MKSSLSMEFWKITLKLVSATIYQPLSTKVNGEGSLEKEGKEGKGGVGEGERASTTLWHFTVLFEAIYF